ncbi:hypothetical protein PTSG_11468 [Salpingoeca rosetta]|uniref:RING-type E3 ubiquitin transferase n=1 Tax=Salpingoeca rosetta (strain ATCC 50818 / BSB-021) TaxID=946362 RepID=F2UTJ3_SALR5|nr:uncharacterized protein PTSG_11468 [Salpingoeca rosetta]EGD83715.1 hypothetical protein PTSG_11468 [Salpingoeca rosetta]|eukprot:XP_004987510.1 hypothetical protein PTSG_11468 [Salpingoeca rosetta]
MHTKEIRDVQACPNGELLLTAGLDKTLRISSLTTNAVVQTFRLPAASWACAWNSTQPVHIYCGLANNNILLFDMRYPTHFVEELQSEATCPIVSLQEYSVGGQWGLLSCDLKGVSFWEISTQSDAKQHRLSQLDGVCTSLSTAGLNGKVLCSYRPSKACNVTRHVVFSLQRRNIDDNDDDDDDDDDDDEEEDGDGTAVEVQQAETGETPSSAPRNTTSSSSGSSIGGGSEGRRRSHLSSVTNASRDIQCTIDRQLLGGPQQTKLARSCILSHPRGFGNLVCASNEANQSALLWDASTGDVYQEVKRDRCKLPYVAFADVTPEQNSRSLAALADGTLEILNWS